VYSGILAIASGEEVVLEPTPRTTKSARARKPPGVAHGSGVRKGLRPGSDAAALVDGGVAKRDKNALATDQLGSSAQASSSSNAFASMAAKAFRSTISKSPRPPSSDGDQESRPGSRSATTAGGNPPIAASPRAAKNIAGEVRSEKNSERAQRVPYIPIGCN